jgi:hypothetical protein
MWLSSECSDYSAEINGNFLLLALNIQDLLSNSIMSSSSLSLEGDNLMSSLVVKSMHGALVSSESKCKSSGSGKLGTSSESSKKTGILGRVLWYQ